MSNVSTAALPLIIPFFGAALALSCGFSCCLWRRASRNHLQLMERVSALEARHSAPQAPVTTQAIVPVYNLPYGAQANYRPSVMTYYPVATAPPMDPQRARSVNL